MTKDEAKEKVAKLVADYQALSPAQARAYHEAKTKQGFVQPLFRCLGWDFDNVEEVAPEEKASSGRVDYAFKLKGVSRFYLEAKSLKADLNNPDYIKQAVTYAYNKGVTWAGLTSFDRLRLFNAQTGHPFLNLVCQNYVDDFDRLWLLSRESVESGALDSEAAQVGALKPAQPIESRLFDQLREWRQELFSQLHSYNTKLTFGQIDEVIQRLFNRLIFIRTCEDRRIEEKTLLAAVNRWEASHKPDLIVSLKDVFKEFDLYYDSDLFTEHPLDHAFIESDTLVRVIRGLYEVPGGQAGYDFSVIDADVLGAVYEQYLGHVAKAVKQRVKESQARLGLEFVDEDISLDAKRQKRKQQGIFYTPRWVTDYIVKHTVGCFIDEHSHDDVVSIKVLDLACGSGSFLIRAYDELLNYHARVRGKPISELDQWERLTVLTGNIFGVDLDGQAVEIARLNLLLRSLARREILPSLADNVRRGNSLISGGEAELKPFFGATWNDKRAFDWKQEFAAVMNKGGFDIIVGNPPYVRIQTLPRPEAEYFRANYEGASGSFDIYVLFIERSLHLLKPGGWLGFICSSKFLKSAYGARILNIIKTQCTVERIVDLSAQTVFAEATTYPAIIVLRKASIAHPLMYVPVPAGVTGSPVISASEIDALPAVLASQEALVNKMWPPLASDDKLWSKLTANTEPLGSKAQKVFVGLQTSADAVYILQKLDDAGQGLVRVRSKATGKAHELEAGLLKPLLSGEDIERYGTPHPRNMLLFPYRVTDGSASLISAEQFEKSYPRCWHYLMDNRKVLEDREHGKMRGEGWYAFGRNQNLTLHDLRKLAIPRLVKHLKAVYDASGLFYLDNVDVGGVILKDQSQANHLYVLGILHSRLMDFCFRRISAPFRGGFRSANRQFIEPLPIRRIDFSSPSDKKTHDDLVVLVGKMLGLNRQLQQTPPEHVEARHDVERQIHQTDEAIDSLVFELYGLNQAERDAIEMGA